jgi:hypothetical protein
VSTVSASHVILCITLLNLDCRNIPVPPLRDAEGCKNQTLDMRTLNNPLLLDVVSTKSTKKVDQSDYSRKLGITLVGISL